MTALVIVPWDFVSINGLVCERTPIFKVPWDFVSISGLFYARTAIGNSYVLVIVMYSKYTDWFVLGRQ